MVGIWQGRKAVTCSLNMQQKKGLVTVACHKMSDDIAKGTEASILKQAQIEKP